MKCQIHIAARRSSSPLPVYTTSIWIEWCEFRFVIRVVKLNSNHFETFIILIGNTTLFEMFVMSNFYEFLWIYIARKFPKLVQKLKVKQSTLFGISSVLIGIFVEHLEFSLLSVRKIITQNWYFIPVRPHF